MARLNSVRIAFAAAAVSVAVSATPCPVPPPPAPEPIDVIELPLPPVVDKGSPAGTCTAPTGCIIRTGLGAYEGNEGGDFQSGDFLPDGKHVLAAVTMAGAPEGGIYTGKQLLIVKTDGTKFPNGDPWKCVTCGVPAENKRSAHTLMDYPQAFNDGRILGGTNVLECGGHLFTSEECTPEKTFIYGLYWPNTVDGSGPGGAVREQRLHPDDVHLAFSNLYIDESGSFGQAGYFSRLHFNSNPTTGTPLAPRYDLVNVTMLSNPDMPQRVKFDGDQITFDPTAISVGELRGVSGRGEHILTLSGAVESGNVDIFSVHLKTGKTRRITNHPEYVDPVDASPDDKWHVLMDTRHSGRQMFMAAMRDVPPLVDMVLGGITSSVRNNGPRRFFQPWLLDQWAERGDYIGQSLNGVENGTPGSGLPSDPEWNAMADPRWSPDGTQVVYWQTHTAAPSCGGANPLPCFPSTADGGRKYRLMVATLTSRMPLNLPPVPLHDDIVPWGVPYVPGVTRAYPRAEPGNYTLKGKSSGRADVTLIDFPDVAKLNRVVVEYHDFSDDGAKFLNGWEDVAVRFPNYTMHHADWYSDLTQTAKDGSVIGTKKTSEDGFHLDLDLTLNNFVANGTLITTIGDKVYRQPQNWT